MFLFELVVVGRGFAGQLLGVTLAFEQARLEERMVQHIAWDRCSTEWQQFAFPTPAQFGKGCDDPQPKIKVKSQAPSQEGKRIVNILLQD